jgi:hypothetical protein
MPVDTWCVPLAFFRVRQQITMAGEFYDRARISIEAGTSYILDQKNETGFDPPKVACAYNAGSIIRNEGTENRWKMKQYPIDSGRHADRFIKWFNDCFRYFRATGQKPVNSFCAALDD